MLGLNLIKHFPVTEGQVFQGLSHAAICIYAIIVYYTAT